MRSSKNVLLWVMLVCAGLMMAGCGKDTGEESALVSVGETELTADMEESAGEGTEEAADNTKADAKDSMSGESRDSAAGKNGDDAAGTDRDGETDASSGAGTDDPDAPGADAAGTGMIYVDVCGQVRNPGVYKLTSDSRVYEAVEKAGGMTKKAAASSVNQAERLSDGQQIYVPSKDEQAQGAGDEQAAKDAGAAKTGSAGAAGTGGSAGAGGSGTANGGKVNLNTASKEELMALSGIGEVKADAMIRYREEHGGFQSVEDVKKIEGIKDGVFNKIKDQITV